MRNHYVNKLTENQLKNIPLFTNISSDMIPILLDLIQVQEYKQGEYIFIEGNEATKIYFIIEGSVQVVKNNIIFPEEKCLAELIAPDFFGEMALIDKGRRSAAVVANSMLIVAELSYENFFKIFSKKPELAMYIYKGIALELSMRIRNLNCKYTYVC